jgi:2-aminoadipate transaminase
LIQRSFDLYLKKGLWLKHLQFMKNTYQERYQIMLKAMQAHLPKEISYTEPGGGLSFWLRLPAGSSANYFYTCCLEKQVIISPGSLFSEKDKLQFVPFINTPHHQLLVHQLYQCLLVNFVINGGEQD